MFAGIQRYMDEGQEGVSAAQGIEIVQKLLHQGLKRPELKDELFMQLLKQSRGNPSPQAAGMCYNQHPLHHYFIIVSCMPVGFTDLPRCMHKGTKMSFKCFCSQSLCTSHISMHCQVHCEQALA